MGSVLPGVVTLLLSVLVAGPTASDPECPRWQLALKGMPTRRITIEEEILTQFHMRNVPAPLDIAFGKADGRIFAILRMEPSPTARYGPLGPFRYALEARAGFFAMHGITQGVARLLSTP